MIIKKNWSDLKKARSIYWYVQHNCSYVNDTRRPEWHIAAYRGFSEKCGDCYTFYAMSRILLEKAGLKVRTGKRIIKGVEGRAGHWWNEVLINGKWEHFDPTFTYGKTIFVKK